MPAVCNRFKRMVTQPKPQLTSYPPWKKTHIDEMLLLRISVRAFVTLHSIERKKL